MVMAYRSATGGGGGAAASSPTTAAAPAPASTTASTTRGGHGGSRGGRGGAFVSRGGHAAGGAGTGSSGGATAATSRPARDPVPEEVMTRVKEAIDEIDLSSSKNFTELMCLKADGVPLYYIKLHPDSSGSFRCMAGEIHASAIKHFTKELDAPVFVIVKFLMLKLYAWLKENNETVLEEMKSNSHWYNCFPENAVKNADIVFMKDRTKILVGKKATTTTNVFDE
jgi:hypothetical protein